MQLNDKALLCIIPSTTKKRFSFLVCVCVYKVRFLLSPSEPLQNILIDSPKTAEFQIRN